MVPSNPTARLRRSELAVALTEAGFPTSAMFLAKMAVHGGVAGPPFQKFGKYPVYTWGDALVWAEARLTTPRRNTAEASKQQQAA